MVGRLVGGGAAGGTTLVGGCAATWLETGMLLAAALAVCCCGVAGGSCGTLGPICCWMVLTTVACSAAGTLLDGGAFGTEATVWPCVAVVVPFGVVIVVVPTDTTVAV